ncbi:hypothetical protein NQT62_03225 [Limnobacter humi]|uniref:Cytochrome c domain-containing protein n=1 Tax=Limnobacter humi TaxID=1778671 RepID=A0ABT1WD54_9BURK|nr:hypothetical protein [Limnobacter humi]MCQ8895450.1 hypothetical protein [Limnobacter humi]
MAKRTRVWVALATMVAVAAGWNWMRDNEARSQASVTALAKVVDKADPHLALSATVLADGDLPPEGTRSLFDHVAAQNGGVPYPFPKLIEALQKMNPEGAPPVAVMLPHGRSLLKGQADDAHPRVLLAADFQAPNTPAALGVNARGQLFLGFVENANEIEVLSYNEAAGRYEFQLVQDYSAIGARKLVYARRQICLTCHQGGAPIFPQRPWNETNAAPDTVEAMLRARTKAGLDTQTYLGLPLQNTLSSPERFDELTDVGNFFATTQQLWLDGCGNQGNTSVDCRKTMLKLALQYKVRPGDFKEEGVQVERLKTLQAKALSDRTIAVAESDLTNRDPVAEQKGIKGWWRSLTTARIQLGDGAKNNEDLEAFDKLPKLPLALDPLTKRAPKRILTAANVDGVYGLASLLTESDINTLMEAANWQFDNLAKAVDKLPDPLFDAKPFERVKTVQALMKSTELPKVRSGGPVQLAYLFTDVSDMSPPIATGVPPLQLKTGSSLEPFETYCFSCHRGNPAKRLNFMGADSEDKVLAQMRDKTEIRDALDWERYEGTDKASMLMPPRDSKQYALMVEDQKKNPKLREQMRAVVPSLFGF